MKIYITGTRGIPNQYGGFEQFAEKLGVGLADRGYEVSVYNPSFHPFRDDTFNKVNLIRKFTPENMIGGAANYIYDYACIKDAIKNKADIILECGYASAAPAYRLLNFRNSRIITHLDGLEWQRTKWSGRIQRLIKKSERTAVKFSHGLICDHPLIQQYFIKEYSIEPVYIPYGADTVAGVESDVLDSFDAEMEDYFLVIARLEPENNIHTVIEGFHNSGTTHKLLIIGNIINVYSHRLKKQYSSDKIVFLEGIYDQPALNALRHFCKACFHGHSVGGTNPSLLEAMAAGAMIIAHDNPFNRYVLNNNGMYFSSADDIARILTNENEWISKKEQWTRNNKKEIQENYQWERMVDQYEELFR